MRQITFHVEVALQAIPSTLALLPDGTCKIQVSINANLNPQSLESLPGANQHMLDSLLKTGEFQLKLVPKLSIESQKLPILRVE